MVNTIKFSEMTDGGDLANNDKTPGLDGGTNVLFNNPWTFLPPGTTAERPLPSPDINFRLRFNTEVQLYEYYDSGLAVWTQLQESAFTQGPFITYTVDPGIPQAQNLGLLSDGLLKQTVALGVATLDVALSGIDYWKPGDALTRTQPPVVGDDVVNKTYVDTTFLTLAGGTMAGDISMDNAFRVTNALDPVNPQDYATKNYIDTNSGTVNAGTINQIAYYAATGNVLSGFSPSLSGVLVSTSLGAPVYSSTMTNGSIIIGVTGGTPIVGSLAAGVGISISTGPGSIIISATGSGTGWTEVVGTSQAMLPDNGYVSSNAALVTLTLPAVAAFGSTISIVGKGAGGWRIAQGVGQNVQIGNTSSTVGVGGTVSSTNRYDSVNLICIVANTTWVTQGAPQSLGLDIL